MPNRERPRCPGQHAGVTGTAAMDPVFRKGPRGRAFVKVPDTFHCAMHDLVARGRPGSGIPIRYTPSDHPAPTRIEDLRGRRHV